MICVIDNCERLAKGSGVRKAHGKTAGMCDMHAQRVSKYGREIRIKEMPLPDRIWPHVKKTDSCWEWDSTKTGGYGVLWVNGRFRRVHRLVWELENGPLDDNLNLLHSCDNPPCVRPDHLRPGTQLENVHDAMERGRHKNPPRHPRDPITGRFYAETR